MSSTQNCPLVQNFSLGRHFTESFPYIFFVLENFEPDNIS